jgi:hypothetical protein
MSERSEFAIFSKFLTERNLFFRKFDLVRVYFTLYLPLHYYKHLQKPVHPVNLRLPPLNRGIKAEDCFSVISDQLFADQHCHGCCNAVQSSAWLLHYIKIKKR